MADPRTDAMVQALMASEAGNPYGVPPAGQTAPPGGPVSGMSNYIQHVGQGIGDLLTGPGRAMMGQMPPEEHYSWGPAAGLAMMGSGLGAAEDASLGALYLRQAKGTRGPKWGKFDIMDDSYRPHEPVGGMEVSYNPESKKAYIGDIYAGDVAGEPNAFGPTNMRSLIESFKQFYPDAKSVWGYRVSGARTKAGKEGRAEMPLRPDDTSKALMKDNGR